MKNNAQDLKTITDVILEKLCTYISESQKGKKKTLIQKPAEEIAKLLQLEMWIKEGGLDPTSVNHFIDTYLANTQHMHHPQYMGHQVAVPHVASGIADFIHGIINNPMAIYEMGPAAAVIERFIVNWMLDKVGWFKGSHLSDFKRLVGNGGGVLTHGGSLANLTALSAARASIAPDSWTNGTPSDLVILAPEEAHYSIARSISIMGMGQNAVIPVAVNKLKVMKPEILLSTYQKVKENGKRVMAVVANACTTATGLYDPLDEIGHFCEEHKVWYHIDGAHGASALISDKEKHLLKGIDRADSLIWDAHKMMRTSSLCAAVLFKDYQTMERAFQQKGSYIFHDKEEMGFDTLPYTIECTKAAIGTKLFWVLAAEGEKGMATYIEDTYNNTRQFYQIINQHPDFYCPYVPEANILCFQFTKFGTDNNFQLQIRNEIVNRGSFYITSTELNNVRYLRLTIMNDLTRESHIKSLIEEIINVASDIKSLE
jgi:L-2,4-diaminobutyrate decarboxylase